MTKKKRFYARFLAVVPEVVVIKELRGHPCKIKQKMVFLTNESANKAEIDILSARDTTRPGP